MLSSVDPRLAAVVRLALVYSSVPFRVTEGLRTLDRQRSLVDSGASRTMRSKHLCGHAVDVVALVDGVPRWDWPLYTQISLAFKRASKELKTPIIWGGDWRTFKDGPHFELA